MIADLQTGSEKLNIGRQRALQKPIILAVFFSTIEQYLRASV